MRSLVLTVILAVAAFEAPQNTNATIEGTVTHYGLPAGIANVGITLAPEFAPAIGYLAPETVTDANGHFTLRDVLPGKYTIYARRSGYANPAPNGVRLRDGGTTRTVTVTPGQHIRDAGLSLVPGAVVTGRILDPSGRPLPAVTISASPVVSGEVDTTRSSETDDRGNYRIFGLETGNYVLSISARRDAWLKTYFPGVVDAIRATSLKVTEGALLAGVDFSAQAGRTFKISGKVVSPNAGLAGSQIYRARLIPRGLIRDPKTGNSISNAVDSRDASHIDFEFRNVPSGSYDLFVEVASSGGIELLIVAGPVSLDVNSQDIAGLTIIPSGVEVRARVTIVESAAVAPVGTFGLALVPQDIRTREVKPDANGMFSIPSVFGGTWKVVASKLPTDLAVADVRQGARSVYEDGFVVTDEMPGMLEIVLSPAGAIEGIVRDAQQEPVAAAKVVLVPASPLQSSPAMFRTATTDAAGRFSFAAVVTGSYAVFGFESPSSREEPIPSANRALQAYVTPFASQGSSVRVTSGSTTNIVIAPVRPK